MEKAKSLLIYYSNRFLDGSLDYKINNKFGKIFRCYNQIIDLGEKNLISQINTKDFSEDSIMRYHFLAYDNEKYDHWATRDQVLSCFLKPKLKELSKIDNINKMEKFINDYVTDLESYFRSFLNLLKKIDNNKYYYKLFSILNLSANLYPLVIRLHNKNILEDSLIINSNLTFLELIEIADVRVYKTRGTDPQKDVYELARRAKNMNNQNIEDELLSFINKFMNDRLFRNKLEEDIYGNQGLVYIFIEYSEKLRDDKKGKYSLNELKELNNNKSTRPTIEHIFAQEPRFEFPNRSFDSAEEYFSKINKLGNLTLLKKETNSKCQDKTPEEKIQSLDFYIKSPFDITSELAAEIKDRGNSFNKKDINKRTLDLADFCVKRWSYN